MASIVRKTDRRAAWVVRWKDRGGTHRSKSFATHADARDWLPHAQLREQHARLADGDPRAAAAEVVTFGQQAHRWQLGRSHLSHSQRGKDRAALDRWLLPELGHRLLPDVHPDDLAAVLSRVTASGHSSSLRRVVAATACAVMDAAVAGGRIDRHRLRAVRVGQERRQRQPWILADNDIAALLTELPAPHRLMALCMLVGGLRWGEAAALTVDRVRREERTLVIDRAVTRTDGGRPALGQTKTGHTRRIRVPAALVENLCEHADASGSLRGQLLFPTSAGTPLDSASWRRRVWTPACERALLVGLHPYDLRHTAATRLVERGMDAGAVAAYLGHSVRMTLEVYLSSSGRSGELLEHVTDEYGQWLTSDAPPAA